MVAKVCRTYCVRPAGRSRGVVSIVRVGARLATCHSDAGQKNLKGGQGTAACLLLIVGVRRGCRRLGRD